MDYRTCFRSLLVLILIFGLSACGGDDSSTVNSLDDPEPSCEDGEQSGDQTDVDCGGDKCPPCEEGQGCEVAEDCETNACRDGVCVAPSCDDGEQTGDQTDIDCGGEECPACPTGASCVEDDDCASDLCVDEVCVLPDCDEVDCGDDATCYRGECYDECELSAQCEEGDRCLDGRCVPLDCQDVVCDVDETCYQGVCYPDCETSEDCDDEFATCEDGACVLPNCVDDGMTPDGEECPLLDFDTGEPVDVEATEATLIGEIYELPEDPPAEHGFCWSSDSDEPELGDDDSECVSVGPPLEEGEFSYRVEDLDPGTEYHVRAVFAEDFEADGDQDLYLGAVVEMLTQAPEVTDVSATQGTSLESVEVSWQPVDGATGYQVQRDGDTIGTVDDDVTELSDDSAEPSPGAKAPSDVVASQGDYHDVITVEWQEAEVEAAPVHEYTVIALYPDTSSAASEPAEGYLDSEEISHYEVEIDGEWTEVGLATSYDDENAPSPTLEAGEVIATSGDHTDYVEVTIDNSVTEDGDGVEYRVRAMTESTEGEESDSVTGYRGVQDPEVEIYRDGDLIATVDSFSYQDEGADAPGTPEAVTAMASSGDYREHVVVEWDDADVPDGTSHDYTAIVVDGPNAGDESDPATGYRGAYEVTSYEIEIDGGDWSDVGHTTTYTDEDAPAPVLEAGDITASEGDYADYVDVVIEDFVADDGATVDYRVRAVNDAGAGEASDSTSGHRGVQNPEIEIFRDGTPIATISSSSYQDTGADEGGVPTAPDLTVTSGDHADRVDLTWDSAVVPDGTTHEYTAAIIDGSYSSDESDPDIGYRAGYAIDDYEVHIDGSWTSVGLVSSYADYDAPAPTIDDAGSVSASKGLYGDYVLLEHDGAEASDGAERTYEVRAINATGTSDSSGESDGYRGVGDIELQWQRSAGDTDGDYSALSGADESPYEDTDAPSDGSQRYFRVVVSADGADDDVHTDADIGYRATYAQVATTSITDIDHASATLNGSLMDPGIPETISHGLCISSSPQPEPGTADCNDLGSTTSSGDFDYHVDGLAPGTSYHARAYAETNAGLSFGAETIFFTESTLTFVDEADWEMGSPTPYTLWDGLLEMEWTTDTPSNSTGIRFNGVSGNSGGTPYFYEVDVDLSDFNEMSVYTRKDNHNLRNMIIEIDGNRVYDSGDTHSWTERTFDVSGYDGETTIRLGVESSSGDGDWTAGFADLTFSI